METRLKPLLLLSSACFFALLIAFFTFPLHNSHHNPQYRVQDATSFKAPRENVWAELTESEAHDVYDFLFDELSHLNLTRHPKSARDSFIYIVETLRPNKTDAVSYLYNDATVPERWAKAAVSQQFDDRPHIVYYMAGPLPITSRSKVLPLNYVFNNGANYIQNPVLDFQLLMDFGLTLAENVSDITQELLGAVVNRENPNDPHSLVCWPRTSSIVDKGAGNGGLLLWFQLYRPGVGLRWEDSSSARHLR